ncbi:Hypothetical predicted protein [Octopus vulgaris]|uniref:Uncharacterized protein n=1 Tax=Octopus vulgaris TaxID=6645 RepID=A0AA36BHK9_OCTVU|nr:Hypothetical predicted protein [Octopus vulgaris]
MVFINMEYRNGCIYAKCPVSKHDVNRRILTLTLIPICISVVPSASPACHEVFSKVTHEVTATMILNKLDLFEIYKIRDQVRLLQFPTFSNAK